MESYVVFIFVSLLPGTAAAAGFQIKPRKGYLSLRLPATVKWQHNLLQLIKAKLLIARSEQKAKGKKVLETLAKATVKVMKAVLKMILP